VFLIIIVQHQYPVDVESMSEVQVQGKERRKYAMYWLLRDWKPVASANAVCDRFTLLTVSDQTPYCQGSREKKEGKRTDWRSSSLCALRPS